MSLAMAAHPFSLLIGWREGARRTGEGLAGFSHVFQTNQRTSDTTCNADVNDDAELVERIRRGAHDEFSELVRRHQARVFSLLGRYARSQQTVEDLAQETFVKAWRALDRYDGRGPFEHWLSVITVRVALDYLRREKHRREEISLPDLGEDALDWLRHDGDDAEIGARQAAELLDLAMKELSPDDRVVLTLQEIEGRSVKEISQLLGCSGVAVRVRALRARSRLKKALEKLGEIQN
jgi:RNA polymerase sigma-70 factor, ECF subfamily